MKMFFRMTVRLTELGLRSEADCRTEIHPVEIMVEPLFNPLCPLEFRPRLSIAFAFANVTVFSPSWVDDISL
jgi:hypothetical protein